jgi:hypothetical protein
MCVEFHFTQTAEPEVRYSFQVMDVARIKHKTAFNSPKRKPTQGTN